MAEYEWINPYTKTCFSSRKPQDSTQVEADCRSIAGRLTNFDDAARRPMLEEFLTLSDHNPNFPIWANVHICSQIYSGFGSYFFRNITCGNRAQEFACERPADNLTGKYTFQN